MSLDLDSHYESTVCQLSTLGVGRSGLVKKSLSLIHVLLMRVGSDEDFHTKRKQYRGSCQDGGTEKGICQITVDILPKYRGKYQGNDPDRYIFPKLIFVIGKLHGLWGGLEQCIKASPLNTEFIAQLTTVQYFTSDKSLMRRFRATCFDGVPGAAKLFEAQPNIAIDWRWETISRALDTQIPIHETLRIHFDKNKVLSSDSGSLLTNQTVNNVDSVLKSSSFVPAGEMYHVLGKVTEKYPGLLEICDCHSHIWQKGSSRKRRLAQMRREIDGFHCCWHGRRLSWWLD